MQRLDFLELIGKRVLVCDSPLGALRTHSSGAQAADGVASHAPAAGIPERLALEDCDALIAIHRAALDAGVDLLLTNTVAANRPALALLGLEDQLEAIVRRSVEAACRAITFAGRRSDGTPLVGLVLGSLPQGVVPHGALPLEEAIAAYREVVQAALPAQPDLVVIDGVSELCNLKAALIALRDLAVDLPVVVQVVFRADGRAEDGASPAVVWAVSRSLGADVVGASGGLSPAAMLPVQAAYAAVSDIPLAFQPATARAAGSAAQPAAPQVFVRELNALLAAGIALVGCSGARWDAHLKAIVHAARRYEPHIPPRALRSVLTSRTRDLAVGAPRGLIAAAEWPATRGMVTRTAHQQRFDQLVRPLKELARSGAQMLELRSVLPHMDEPRFFGGILGAAGEELALPLIISAETRSGLEAALRLTAGRPLVAAVWGEEHTWQRVFPVARRFGAAVLAVCHSGTAIPSTPNGRLEVAGRILEAALRAGLQPEDLIFDPVVEPVRAAHGELPVALRAMALIREHFPQPILMRVSRSSDGLPEGSRVEVAFLSAAAALGLDIALINGTDTRMIDAVAAAGLVVGRDTAARRYLGRFPDPSRSEPRVQRDVAQRIHRDGRSPCIRSTPGHAGSGGRGPRLAPGRPADRRRRGRA